MALRVQVPNNHILTQNLYYNYYYPKTQVPNYGVLGPFGWMNFQILLGFWVQGSGLEMLRFKVLGFRGILHLIFPMT